MCIINPTAKNEMYIFLCKIIETNILDAIAKVLKRENVIVNNKNTNVKHRWFCTIEMYHLNGKKSYQLIIINNTSRLYQAATIKMYNTLLKE